MEVKVFPENAQVTQTIFVVVITFLVQQMVNPENAYFQINVTEKQLVVNAQAETISNVV